MEDIVDSQRLYFKDYFDDSATRLLNFTAPGKESCDTVTAYILVRIQWGVVRFLKGLALCGCIML